MPEVIPSEGVVRFGVFELDRRSGELRKAGVRVNLQEQSLQVLTLLLEQPGDLVTREELRQRLWPTGTFGDFDHGLNAVINRLRDTLGDSAAAPRFIETVPRRGYRFIGTIERPRPIPLDTGGPSPLQDFARTGKSWVPWIIAAGACATLTVAALRFSGARSPVSPVPARIEMALPEDMEVYDQAEISPDGRRLVFSADLKGRPQLFIRDLASTAVVGLADTDGAFFPFWSPDSRSIAFFAMGKLKRIGITGGPARVLADAKRWDRLGSGSGTWANGTILFAGSDGSIVRVPDTGGTVTDVGTFRANAGERPVWPRLLPDGRHFVFSKRGDSGVGDSGLYVASLDSTGTQQLPEEGSRALYAAGYLVYFRRSSVFARRFDAARLAFSGPEIAVAQQVASFSVSQNGTIVFKPQRIGLSRLTWFDFRGARLGTLGESGQYTQVVLSPRGRPTVVRPASPEVHLNWDLWDVDPTTGILSRLTTEPGVDSDPSWSPDERHLAFTSARAGPWGVFVKDVVSGSERPLVVRKESVMVDQWTPDGQFIIFRNAGRAVWVVPPSGGVPRMLVDTPYFEDEIHVSPDGRWVAYNADESGRWEVYVARFPDFTSKRQISIAGGVQPQWRADGSELFYLALDRSMMRVHVTPGPEFVGSPPSSLFATHFAPTPPSHNTP